MSGDDGSQRSRLGAPGLDALIRRALWCLAVLILAGGAVWGWTMALSIALGGGIALLNFLLMKAGIGRVLEGAGGRSSAWILVGFIGRLLLILVGLFAIIHISFLSLYGALGGLSIFVLAGLLEAFKLLMRK
jgi:hypothetical protein